MWARRFDTSRLSHPDDEELTDAAAGAWGELLRLLSLVAEQGVNVLEVEHHRTAPRLAIQQVEVMLTLETRDRAHCERLLALMRERGYAVAESQPVFELGAETRLAQDEADLEAEASGRRHAVARCPSVGMHSASASGDEAAPAASEEAERTYGCPLRHYPCASPVTGILSAV